MSIDEKKTEHFGQSGGALVLSLFDVDFEPESVSDIIGTSEFVLQEAYAESLVSTSVARQRVEQRQWSTGIQPLLTTVSSLGTSGVVSLDSSLLHRHDRIIVCLLV